MTRRMTTPDTTRNRQEASMTDQTARHPRFKRGWWCSIPWPHEGPCALRPNWWNLPARWRSRG